LRETRAFAFEDLAAACEWLDAETAAVAVVATVAMAAEVGEVEAYRRAAKTVESESNGW
jgi:hypothetical protein